MKHLLLIIPALCLSANTLAKVTVEDAIESNRPYAEANGAVHIPPDTRGLTEAEFDPDAPNQGETGHWKKVSSSPTSVIDAGAYSQLLTPDAEGQACYKGTKGLILGTERECTNWNSGGWHCEGYGPETVSSDNGYKAECQ